MREKEYELFKKLYLKKFRGYYRTSDVNKKELKKSVFNSPKLNEIQKNDFWELVISK